MAKSGNSRDEMKHNIAAGEIEEFKKLIKGHEKLLKAIGEL